MVEAWFRIKCQRTRIFKSDESLSENIHLFMLDLPPFLFVLNLVRHCHSQQAGYEPTANDSEVVSKS